MSGDVAKSLSKNVAIMTGSRIITYFSSFILMIFLPRHLGPEEYGRLYLGISITGIFAIFINFGGNYSISKSVSRDRDQASSIMMDAVGIRLVFWAVSVVALMVFSFVVNYPATVKTVVLILSIGLLWEAMRSVLGSCFQGFERMEYPSIAGIAYSIFLTSVGVSVLFLGANAIAMAGVMVGAEFVYMVVMLRFGRKINLRRAAIRWRSAFGAVKDGVPYFLQSIFGFIYYRIDTVMLSIMTPAAVVGWYGASYKFFDALMFIPNIYSMAVFPVLARLWQKENLTMSRVTQKSIHYILLAGLPVTVVTFAFSREIIRLLFGLEGYGPSIILLQIFALGSILVYIDWVIGTAVIASDKQRQASFVSFFAIILNIILNYFFIPYTQAHQGNGGIGSAIATLITELYIMVAMSMLLPKDVLGDSNTGIYYKAIGASAVMSGAIWLMHFASIHWILQIPVSVIVYGLSILLFRTLAQAERDFFISILRLESIVRRFFPARGTQP